MQFQLSYFVLGVGGGGWWGGGGYGVRKLIVTAIKQ